MRLQTSAAYMSIGRIYTLYNSILVDKDTQEFQIPQSMTFMQVRASSVLL